jgi:hypothetical protein
VEKPKDRRAAAFIPTSQEPMQGQCSRYCRPSGNSDGSFERDIRCVQLA